MFEVVMLEGAAAMDALEAAGWESMDHRELKQLFDETYTKWQATHNCRMVDTLEERIPCHLAAKNEECFCDLDARCTATCCAQLRTAYSAMSNSSSRGAAANHCNAMYVASSVSTMAGPP